MLRAALADLRHARQALRRDELEHLHDLWPRLERCATRLAGLEPAHRKGLRPALLALLDEVEATIGTFRAELQQQRETKRSEGLSKAAHAAYRQGRGR
jgi:hypothetical protein